MAFIQESNMNNTLSRHKATEDDMKQNEHKQQTIEIDTQKLQILMLSNSLKKTIFTMFREKEDEVEDFSREQEAKYFKL